MFGISRSKLQVVIASWIGCVLEFYDFALFGIFTPVFAYTFFPNDDTSLYFMFSLGIFASGFIMRPLGGILFGHIGDIYGRKQALSISIMLMAVPIFIISILPSYTLIGICAPIILIICRLIQGLCVGGEHNGAAIFLIEHIGKNKSGIASSIILSGVAIGSGSAMISGAFFSSEIMPNWGWRLAFVVGIIISCIGFFIRRYLNESPDYVSVVLKSVDVTFPLKEVFYKYPFSCVMAMIVGGFSGVLSVTLTVYVNVYLSTVVMLKSSTSMLYSVFGLVCTIFTQFAAGIASDHYSKTKIMMIGSIMTCICAFPLYDLLYSGNMYSILISEFILAVLTGLYNGPMHAYLNDLFPIQYRCSGVSFCYSIGMALFGGTTPAISSYLITHTGCHWSPMIYLTFTAICAIIALTYGCSPTTRI